MLNEHVARRGLMFVLSSPSGAGKSTLARKLLGIIYRTLKNNWVFEDFPNFVLAEAA